MNGFVKRHCNHILGVVALAIGIATLKSGDATFFIMSLVIAPMIWTQK